MNIQSVAEKHIILVPVYILQVLNTGSFISHTRPMHFDKLT